MTRTTLGRSRVRESARLDLVSSPIPDRHPQHQAAALSLRNRGIVSIAAGVRVAIVVSPLSPGAGDTDVPDIDMTPSTNVVLRARLGDQAFSEGGALALGDHPPDHITNLRGAPSRDYDQRRQRRPRDDRVHLGQKALPPRHPSLAVPHQCRKYRLRHRDRLSIPLCRASLAARYVLEPRLDPTVTMTRGKRLPVGPTARLQGGVTWDRLGGLSAEQIKAQGVFPYPALPHPLHAGGAQPGDVHHPV
jgi:hypothetical protein